VSGHPSPLRYSPPMEVVTSVMDALVHPCVKHSGRSSERVPVLKIDREYRGGDGELHHDILRAIGRGSTWRKAIGSRDHLRRPGGSRPFPAWSCSFFFPSATGHTCLGFVWQDGEMKPLPTFGGNNGFATGANNHGQVVGWAENTVHDPTCIPPQVLQFRAALLDIRNDGSRNCRPSPATP
jgi:hypothetical protein